MTFRERLADWISGGALSEAREDVVNRESDYMRVMECFKDCSGRLDSRHKALHRIMVETADGKSGTAQKIHRMAKEALGDE